jgi:acetyltransferase-like isoleucine patch superfamily enzyme
MGESALPVPDSRADMRLPRQPIEYLKSPLETWVKAVGWLNARWQMRTCTFVGPYTRVTGRLAVTNRGTLRVGARVRILSAPIRTVLYTLPGGVLEIGDRTFINYGADIAATGHVVIGSDCLIGTHVIIIDNDFHDISDRNLLPKARPVAIGSRVWIGNRVTILPGVTIGDGSVVGAGSVVTRDVPPGCVVAGNPARVVRELTDST